MAFVHRKLWSFKPKQSGPWKIVHRNLMYNLEKIGIDHAHLLLDTPMWNTGDQYDYASGLKASNDGITYSDNNLHFTTAGTTKIAFPTPAIISDDITIIVDVTPNNTALNTYLFDFGGQDEFALIIGFQNGYYNLYGGDYPIGGVAANSQIPASGHRIRDIVVWRKKGSNLAGFVNGVKYIDGTITSGDWSPSANLKIGGRYASESGEFVGSMASYAIYNTDLKDSQIATLSENPWQRFQPIHQKTVFLPIEAGASASLTGTAITGGVTESEIVDGGKTIIITLTGDTWVATVGDDNAITDALIAGITSAQSETNGWNNVVRANMVFGDVARTSDTIVTITLAAEAAYSITSNETITITIPATALTAATEVVATPNIIVANESAGGMVKRLVDDGLLQGLTVGRLAA